MGLGNPHVVVLAGPNGTDNATTAAAFLRRALGVSAS